MPSLVAREAEFEVLASACREARAGSGRFALVTGEAGIGKSWLVQALADSAARHGAAIARGWCPDDAAAPPLWMWRRVARDVPGLRTALDVFVRSAGGAEARLALAEDVVLALATAAGRAGLVVVLDDVQWADELSLDLLRGLLPELPGMPVLVVATARDDDETPAPLGAALPQLVRAPHTLVVPLRGLSEDDVRRWLAADPATAAWSLRAREIVRLTEGNPFYVRSLVDELAQLPAADITAALAERPVWRIVLVAPLQSLPPAARHVVGLAAVLGERLSPPLVAAAAQRPLDEVGAQLSAAVQAGVLHFGPTGLAFRHALVREAIVAGLHGADLDDAHAGAARALQASGDPLSIGPAALHWSHVPGPEAARHCRDLATIAARAAAGYAPDRGVELACLALERARSLGAGPAEVAERLLLCARLEWAAGQPTDAMASCLAGVDLAEATRRPDLTADFALVPEGLGDPDVALQAAEMGRRALEALPADDVVRRARLLATRAVALVELRQPTMAPGPAGDTSPGRPPGPRAAGSADADPHLDPDALSAEAVRVARRSGDPQAELQTIAARHYVLSHPFALEERAVLAARAVALAPRAATTMGAIWGHLWEADLALQRGDVHDVRRTIDRLDEVARTRGSRIARWHVLRLTAALDVFEGRFDEACSTADEAGRIAERVRDLSMIGMNRAFHVAVAHLRGEPAAVPRDIVEVIRYGPPMPLVRVSLVLVRVLAGDLDGAREALKPFHGLAERFPLGPRWLATVGQIGWAAVAVEDRELARSCYDLLLPCAPWCAADGGGAPVAAGSCERLLGDLARTLGHAQVAADHFRRAVAVDDEIGAAPYAALGRLGLAETLAESEPARALALARVAGAEFGRLDMPGRCAQAAALATRLAGPMRSGVVPAGGLTAREAAVADLVGEALTNREIADRLVVSVRTVESHVRSILAKLGLTTRTEIAVWVHTRGGPTASR